VLLLASQLSAAVVAAGANVLLARALAPSGRGEVALFLQIAYLASQLMLLGRDRSFVPVYAGATPAAATRGFVRLLIGPCLASVAVVLVLEVTAPGRDLEWHRLVILVVMFAVGNAASRAVRCIGIASGRSADFLCYTLAYQGLLLALLCSLYEMRVSLVSVWMSAYATAVLIPTLLLVRHWLRGEPLGPEDDRLKRQAVRREGLVLLPSSLANTGMLRFDRLLLPALASTAALGLYATVSTLTELVAWPLQAFADAQVGKWRQAHLSGQLATRRIYGAALGYLAVVIPLFGALVYVSVVPLFGASYADARQFVPPLVLAAAVYGLSRIRIALLIARRHNATASTAECVGFVGSLLGYFLWIPSHGGLGAAWGSVAGYSACLVYGEVAGWRLSQRRGG
jgi:O-antigen/teichoic acid export membrane protein